MSSSRPGLLGRLEARLRGVFAELAKFGTVGALSFVIDVTIFNVVLLFLDKPLTAKVISTVFSATNAFVLNRAWSFKHRERTNVRREYSLFFVLNVVGLSISLLCLAVSHYVLGFTSRLADNIAANVIGLGLGTAFRFLSYRRWVFPELLPAAAAPEPGDPPLAAPALDISEGPSPLH